MSLRFVPTSKRAKIAPFVGGGVDAVFYQYEEFGDFIDFFDPNLEIYGDHFIDDGVAFGLHAFGGLRVYLNRDFAIVGEARYMWADTDMGDDFAPERAWLRQPDRPERLGLDGRGARTVLTNGQRPAEAAWLSLRGASRPLFDPRCGVLLS